MKQKPPRQQLVALYAQHTDAEIAERYDVSPATVRRWRRADGIPSRSRGPRSSNPKKVSKVSDSELRQAIAQKHSVAAVMRAVGLAETGSAHAAMKKRIAELGVDTSHFGRKRESVLGFEAKKRPLEDILRKGTRYSSYRL